MKQVTNEIKVPNPDSAAAKSDLISEDPLMKKPNINYTTANNRNRSILEEFTVYVLIK